MKQTDSQTDIKSIEGRKPYKDEKREEKERENKANFLQAKVK